MWQRDHNIPASLQLHKDQQALTSEQEMEASRFAAERIQAQLSTKPVDEQEAGELLNQAYQVAGLEPPGSILWLDGPLELVELFVPSHMEASVDAKDWERLIAGVGENVGEHIWKCAWKSVEASVAFRLIGSVRGAFGSRIGASETNISRLARANVEANVDTEIWSIVRMSVRPKVKASLWEGIRAILDYSISASVRAYAVAPTLGVYRFFDEYLAPNNARALAQFNELVSGYWLGKNLALIVRRPKILSRDANGRLHSATGKCVEYHDGWGFYARHGVQVPDMLTLSQE